MFEIKRSRYSTCPDCRKIFVACTCILENLNEGQVLFGFEKHFVNSEIDSFFGGMQMATPPSASQQRSPSSLGRLGLAIGHSQRRVVPENRAGVDESNQSPPSRPPPPVPGHRPQRFCKHKFLYQIHKDRKRQYARIILASNMRVRRVQWCQTMELQ